MSKKNIPSLTKQVCDELLPMLKNGEGRSKHYDKKNGKTIDKIYSYSTFENYKKHCIQFAKYCKSKHGCRTLKSCRKYVNEYLESRFNLSAYTVKLDAAALAKLYHCSTKDFIKTPSRHRSDITRSRGSAERDKHFSVKNNADYVNFCKSVGGRAKEIRRLRGSDLVEINGKYYIHFHSGTKGGRERYAPVIGDVALVVRMMNAAGDGKVFTKIPSNADTHSYRAYYAKSLYNQLARPLNGIPFDRVNKGTGRAYQSQVYVCKGDKKGVKYDRRAMAKVSKALGHNRVSVIASNYLY